jgi:hypothetical protein
LLPRRSEWALSPSPACCGQRAPWAANERQLGAPDHSGPRCTTESRAEHDCNPSGLSRRSVPDRVRRLRVHAAASSSGHSSARVTPTPWRPPHQARFTSDAGTVVGGPRRDRRPGGHRARQAADFERHPRFCQSGTFRAHTYAPEVRRPSGALRNPSRARVSPRARVTSHPVDATVWT